MSEKCIKIRDDDDYDCHEGDSGGGCLGIKVELIFEGRIYHQPTQYCHEIENLDVKARANQVCESVGGRMKGKRGCVKAYRRVRICFEMYRM